MPRSIEELRNLAEQARSEFGAGSIARPLLRKLYLSYNQDVGDADSFLAHATEIFPVGNCGLASIYLRELLGEGEVTQGYYQDEAHTFLLVNGQIIDITADQFGGPEVYVGEFTQPWRMG